MRETKINAKFTFHNARYHLLKNNKSSVRYAFVKKKEN